MALPTHLVVNGSEYTIDPSFSNCLQIMLAYEDGNLLDEVKVVVMLRRLYNSDVPLTEPFVTAASTFLDGEEEPVGPGAPGRKNAPRLFSFGQDLKYIRAGIQRTHGVNLREVPELHWWKFLDMFMDMDEECMFSRILQLRQQKARGKLNKEEKKIWAEMSDILTLKTPEMLRAAAEAEAFEAELERLENLGGK